MGLRSKHLRILIAFYSPNILLLGFVFFYKVASVRMYLSPSMCLHLSPSAAKPQGRVLAPSFHTCNMSFPGRFHELLPSAFVFESPSGSKVVRSKCQVLWFIWATLARNPQSHGALLNQRSGSKVWACQRVGSATSSYSTFVCPANDIGRTHKGGRA